ncbi:MAG: CpaF family protein [Phycisphaerae bacterium]|nr:CpaF family protein [Phycisphaerae bacterium]
MLFNRQKQSKSDAPSGGTSTAVREPNPDTLKNKVLSERSQQLQDLKGRLHRKLVDRLDLTRMETEDKDTAREQVKQVVAELADEEQAILNFNDRQRLISEVIDEVFGLGPLEVLLKDPTITDILVNGAKQVYVERGGRLEPTDVQFKDDAHLLHIIDKIVSAVGRRCDEVSPMVDARLPDGSRVNAVIPPLAIDGPSVSIRRFGADPVRMDDLLQFKSITQEMVDFLCACVKARLNVLIVGGTGSGKTTLLNNLSSFIPSNERIVTIEDAAELILQQPHVVRLESRPPNIEGKGQVAIRDLLINSLRMRPDRIIVGEVRGAEALDMLQAMNTGHDGSMTTVHANTPRDAIGRIETMVSMAGYDLPVKAIRQQFASAVNILVQGARLTGGPRRVLYISEVTGMEGETITMQDLFVYKQEGVDGSGRAYGSFCATGIRPTFLEKLRAYGADVDVEIFEPRVMMKDYEE